MNKKKNDMILKVIGWIGTIIFIIAIGVSFYMMVNHMGQVPGLDFGPGQYYYTDIPNWQKYFVPDFYDNNVPMWVLIALFFMWGFMMYRLWTFLEERFDK